MTALTKYAKLEGSGLWAGSGPDQRREVIVSFGDATLVIMDSKSAQVLSHWSLPAVERLNPGKLPAIYSPDADHAETLELDDDLLIEALTTLRAALNPPMGFFQRLRRFSLAGGAAAAVALGVFVVPSTLVKHTTSVVPLAKRVELGEAMLTDLGQDGARICQGGLGVNALAALQRRLFDGPTRLVVVDGLTNNNPRVQHMPGRIFAIDARLLNAAESPEELAGAILVAASRATNDNPLAALLHYAGSLSTFRLLTSGDLPARALRGHAAALLRAPAHLPEVEDVLAQFTRAGVSPMGFILSPLPMDPWRDTLAPALRLAPQIPQPGPVLSDGQWVSLLSLCD
jgi:hypothetical protein